MPSSTSFNIHVGFSVMFCMFYKGLSNYIHSPIYFMTKGDFVGTWLHSAPVTENQSCLDHSSYQPAAPPSPQWTELSFHSFRNTYIMYKFVITNSFLLQTFKIFFHSCIDFLIRARSDCITPIKLITDKNSSFKVFIVCVRMGELGMDGDRRTETEKEDMTFGSQFSLTLWVPVTELRPLDSAVSAFTHTTTSLPQDPSFGLLVLLD